MGRKVVAFIQSLIPSMLRSTVIFISIFLNWKLIIDFCVIQEGGITKTVRIPFVLLLLSDILSKLTFEKEVVVEPFYTKTKFHKNPPRNTLKITQKYLQNDIKHFLLSCLFSNKKDKFNNKTKTEEQKHNWHAQFVNTVQFIILISETR